ncbi:MAG: DUF4956 domain-containing protein [Gemmatimonadales bacterium]|nr:DUF4956 domain-containing protein [Gemmatimonadales bacterium]
MVESLSAQAPPSPPDEPTGVVRRLVDRFTYPAEHPFTTLTMYYVLLVGVAAIVLYFVPSARAMVSGERLAQLLQGGGLFDGKPGGGDLSWSTTLDMALAMLGAFTLMMPTSWVYMAERRRKGFDQGMVQTMIVLSLAIAGVVVIVRNSTALAFSLTGIVAAVRFRNTLADTRDTLYIFTGIGVGLAAGVQALAAALVLSAIFNFVTLLFWRGDYGMCELGRAPRHLLVGVDAAAKDTGKGKKSKKDFNAVLLVRALDAQRARSAVDPLLEAEVSRFELAEVDQNRKGQGVLKYRIRLGRKTDPRALEDALLTRAAPTVIGARVH